ncbi:MAG: EscU/YscU/HrcU family type III secretion system export apparatus switch protein, partial [Oscillospiraceae bacterium]
LGILVYNAIMKKIPIFPRAMDLSPMDALIMTGESIMGVISTVAAVLIALAAADWGYQWWEYEKNLRMSKQDIKDEYKQMEGNPEIKGKIKQKQREMSQARIKYDAEKDKAPTVVAKGADLLALKIVEIAEESKVYVTENVPLARGLYEEVDIGREIPTEFYGEVAAVLAFIYNLKKKNKTK